MDKRRRLPIGMDDFEKLRTNELYYVDKSGLIKELMENGGEVNLFTRPGRFGKSLNMSMLQCFFEYGRDPALFDGLEIAQEKEICQKYMGKFPVIFISLKDVCGHRFDMARGLLSHRTDWWVYSNAESGDGFADIMVECEEKGVGIVIEVKYPDGGDLEAGCREALEQIERMGYETKLRQDGLEHIIRYGIACNRRKCKVAVAVEGGGPGGAVSKRKANIPQETDTAVH